MLYAPLDKILERFYDAENQSDAIRPTRCKREGCPEEEHFHRHDSYPRKSVYRNGVGWVTGVRVQRFLCVRCGNVFALIPPSHYKWQRADHVTQQAVAFGQYDPTILLEHFSKRTLQRWRQKWNVWASNSAMAVAYKYRADCERRCTRGGNTVAVSGISAQPVQRKSPQSHYRHGSQPVWRMVEAGNPTMFVTVPPHGIPDILSDMGARTQFYELR